MKSAYLNDEFFSRLETLALNLRADLNGYFGGKHFVRSYGQTVEFADYREYQLGDDIRRIDWNLFSRFEKYFIRLAGLVMIIIKAANINKNKIVQTYLKTHLGGTRAGFIILLKNSSS